ncbi:MAG: thioredoxin family protein [bacterium]
MKRIIFLALLTLGICSWGKAETVKWYTWNEGYELAKKENKPILIFIQASWCNMCKRLNDKTFNSEEVSRVILSDYIPVKYDVDVDLKVEKGFNLDGKDLSGKELLIKFIPSPQLGVPLTVVWTPGSDRKEDLQGLADPEEMKEFLNKYSNKK